LSSIRAQQAARHKKTPAYRNVVPLPVYILLIIAAAAVTVSNTIKTISTIERIVITQEIKRVRENEYTTYNQTLGINLVFGV
jgi:hypothetical protein